MKKFSEIIGGQQATYITEANDNNDGAAIADKLLAEPFTKQPDYVVADNPKMVQLADTFIKLINRKCGWDGYTFPYMRKINDIQTVIVVNKKVEGEAVAITPTQNGTSAVLRYFLNFAASIPNQEAEYTISSKNMGTVKMFEFLFDVINHPSAFTTGMYESKENNDGEMVNESKVGETDTYYEGYCKAVDTSVYKAFKRWQPNTKTPSQIGGWITWDGLQEIIEYIKANKNKLPNEGCVLYEQIMRDTDLGAEIRKFLVGTPKNKGAAALARYLYDVVGIRRESNVVVELGEEVEVTDEVASEYTELYKGLDISFARYIWGGKIDKLKEEIDKYFSDLDDLAFRIEKLVEMCNLPRIEKRKLLHVGSTAIIISGTAGIGKSDAWRTVRNKLHLQKGKDYAMRDNGSCNATELYKFIYSNNGKFLVLDDTPELFDSQFQQSLWKKALEPENDFSEIEAPTGQTLGENTKGMFYNLEACEEGGVMNSRKRYFKECPNFDKTKKTATQTPDDDENLKTKYTMVPNKMKIMSRFLIITNMTEAQLRKASGESWGAIESRGYFKRLAPPNEVVWARIKQKLLEIKANNDTTWFVPPQYVDEIIEVVENEFKEFGCDKLTWRAFTNGDLTLDLLYGRDWKRLLRSQITTTVEMNDDLNELRRQKRKARKGI